MITPLVEITKTKKTNREFNRFHSDRYARVKKSWRKPRGIDNRVRRKLSGAIKMPNIGYKNCKLTRHILKNGFKKVLVSNVEELRVLTTLNKFYAAEIRHGVGAKKRIEIVNEAEKLNILVLNRNARLVEDIKE
ncbi:60S ribosomal protein L32 [Astathelohania contejeani]|uniref:60S ribosomal protein L32 n=1 Tax=Astathelohania contejeani TaxID=164912 RepID=A0ABQ7I1D5_9MICR|nr:60S ribosomal protein L32 [Thelohania contejeani]